MADAQASIYRDLAACDATCPIGVCIGYMGCRLCQGSECTSPEAVFRGGRTCVISGPFSCQPLGARLSSPESARVEREGDGLDACYSSCSTGTCKSRVECRACMGADCSSAQARALGGKTCTVAGPFSCQEVRPIFSWTLGRTWTAC